jgi:homoserine dehydrogenase
MGENEATRNIGVAILGLGTVGSSVYKLLKERDAEFKARFGIEFVVRKALVRDPEKDRGLDVPEGVLTTDIDEVLGDPEVQVVLELMGGVDPAFDHVSKALRTGRPVVTANKHMLAVKGTELELLSLEEGIPLRYEASVAAVIPIVAALGHGINALEVKRIRGILNGTTNFILSSMYDEGMSYEEALRIAQNRGIAEPDPEMDVSGMDAAHKLCILSRLVLGKFIPLDEVEVKGIGPEIEMMVQGSKRRGKKVKLVAELYLGDTGIGGRPGPFVEPMEISQDDCFYRVNGTENTIEIETFDTGRIEMTGRGAGGKETATAVVSDLLSIAVWLSRRKR